MPHQENIEIRSEEVQEILSHIPNWLIRWGITLIFVIIFVLILASWFIKYPDTVTARAVLTTEIPPVHLVARTDGQIDLIKLDGQEVEKEELLGVIENPADLSDVLSLIKRLNFIKSKIYSKPIVIDEIQVDESYNFGAFQSSYLSFISIIKDSKRLNSISLYPQQRAALISRISYYENLNKGLENQLVLLQEEIVILKGIYQDDSLLYTQGAGTKTQMNRSRANYLAGERSRETLKSSVVQNNIQIAQLTAQISELRLQEQEASEQFESRIIESFERLESDLLAWKQNFLILSPIQGRVSFAKFWSDNQYVSQGEEVMTVVPDSQNIIGRVAMPIQGSGKVEIGQKVNIKLDNYPYNEYGMIIGEIEKISAVPSNELYQIRISLPKGLISTYNRELLFKQEMQGIAEIVTEDKRLIERVFNQLRNIVDRTQ